MSHWARVVNNIVQNVVVVDNENVLNDQGVEDESIGIDYLNSIHPEEGEGTWVQTSYNQNFRKKYAGIGDTYDKENNVFISPQPYPSWTLDENFDWQPPVAEPEDNKMQEDGSRKGHYQWNENKQIWEELDTTG